MLMTFLVIARWARHARVDRFLANQSNVRPAA
jgi:hypothetical protein